MYYSNDWVRFRQAEDDFFARKAQLFKNGDALLSDLKTALNSVPDVYTALRILSETKSDRNAATELLPGIVDAAIDGNATSIVLARQALAHYTKEEWSKAQINSLTKAYLNQNDEWHYRRIAELYQFLGYTDLLNDFTRFCKTHKNAEIQEIGEDFSL